LYNDPMRHFDLVATPLGRLRIVVSDIALLHICFPRKSRSSGAKRSLWGERIEEKAMRKVDHPLIVRFRRELKEYFAGKRKKFTVPIKLEGTPFQKKTWRVLGQI